MLSWTLVVTSLVLVLPLTVQGDLGMSITVANLATSVQASVGQGVTPLVQANATIQSSIVQNDNGAIVALISTINKIVSPLNTFLESITLTASDGSTNSSVLFYNLNNLASQTQQSLVGAASSVVGMENKTNPMLYSEIVGNITELTDNVVSVNTSFGAFSAAVDQVQSSAVTITSDNVSTIITSAIVNSLISPLNGISANLNNLSSLTAAIVMEKNTAYTYQTVYTGSFRLQQENYQTIYISSIERAIADANNTIAALSTGFESSVTEAYSPLRSQLSPGSLSNLTVFLDVVGNLTHDFMQKTNQSFTALQQNVTQILTNQSQIVITNLYNAVNNLTNSGFASASIYANRCILYYGPQFTLSPVFIGRLSQCSVVESDTLAALVQIVRILLDQVKSTAVSSASAASVCQQNPGRCSDLFFSAFPDLTQQTSTQLNTTANVVDEEAQVIQKRVNLCATAATADFDDYDQSILNTFNSCLQTGL